MISVCFVGLHYPLVNVVVAVHVFRKLGLFRSRSAARCLLVSSLQATASCKMSGPKVYGPTGKLRFCYMQRS
jgi:hypothetical protein